MQPLRRGTKHPTDRHRRTPTQHRPNRPLLEFQERCTAKPLRHTSSLTIRLLKKRMISDHVPRGLTPLVPATIEMKQTRPPWSASWSILASNSSVSAADDVTSEGPQTQSEDTEITEPMSCSVSSSMIDDAYFRRILDTLPQVPKRPPDRPLSDVLGSPWTLPHDKCRTSP